MQNDGSQSCHNLLSYAYVVYYMIAQSVNFNALIHMCNLAKLLRFGNDNLEFPDVLYV